MVYKMKVGEALDSMATGASVYICYRSEEAIDLMGTEKDMLRWNAEGFFQRYVSETQTWETVDFPARFLIEGEFEAVSDITKEYKVIAGDMLLGRTSDYTQAVEWMNSHNEIRVSGPCARIVESSD